MKLRAAVSIIILAVILVYAADDSCSFVSFNMAGSLSNEESCSIGYDDEFSSLVHDASAIEGVNFIELDKGRLESVMQEMISSGLQRLNLLLPLGMFSLDVSAFSSILGNMENSVIFTIREADLNPEQFGSVHGMSVYDVSIVCDDEPITFFDTKIEIAVKHDLTEGKNAQDIYVLHVDDSGNVDEIDAEYDGRYVIFETNHTSYFAVAYDDAADMSGYRLLVFLIIVLTAVCLICRNL